MKNKKGIEVIQYYQDGKLIAKTTDGQHLPVPIKECNSIIIREKINREEFEKFFGKII